MSLSRRELLKAQAAAVAAAPDAPAPPAEAGTMVISALGLADPGDKRFNGDIGNDTLEVHRHNTEPWRVTPVARQTAVQQVRQEMTAMPRSQPSRRIFVRMACAG